MSDISKMVKIPIPPYRRLRSFAFDPVISRQIDTYDINEVTLNIPWDEDMTIGPVDGYIEVVDYDPASQAFYAPVDLNDPRLIAQDGLPPSEGNPQFHQQMVYAIVRTTISHFEYALGRRTLWSPHQVYMDHGKTDDEFVERLRIYPHAMREANAYYSPEKKALLFGYFPASTKRSGKNMPGEVVFTCLSHDIVAHETTHALIDGLHPKFIEPSNTDAFALHEAIADIVALFQHFTYPDVLKHQISRTRGDLEGQSMLGELAYQFGQAVESYGALRSAIGKTDPDTGKWIPNVPDPLEISKTSEPHARGAILVAAVFDAFLNIYRSKIRDLMRIATNGTGVLPQGEIHPDLVARLANEASKTASHVLHMCIRALDYVPPVDINFGDYLRALITADLELVSDDTQNYRIAMIDAFRKRGIYPKDIRNLSTESLVWHVPTPDEQTKFQRVFQSPSQLLDLVPDWGIESERDVIFSQEKEAKRKLCELFSDPDAIGAANAAHLTMNVGRDSIFRDENTGVPLLEVNSVRPARRIGPTGQTITELVIEIIQSRRGYFDKDIQTRVDSGEIDPPEPNFVMLGGCTLLVDLKSAIVRYCIYKDITSQNRLEGMREYIRNGDGCSLRATYFGNSYVQHFDSEKGPMKMERLNREPFALLHESWKDEEEI